MKFLKIEYLFLIWTLPVLALAYLYGWRKRNKILNAYAVRATLDRIVPAGMAARRRLKAVIVLGALLLLVTTMAGPVCQS